MSSFMAFDTMTPSESLFTDYSKDKFSPQLIGQIGFKHPFMEPQISVGTIIQEVMSSLAGPQSYC